ncbi:BQ5605_C004g03096 [Microbotryum silenes-dioicae]|uniref:BQ5605_C004g03096 protein n=1 Tax=Microbotryum silenes-dioicae TaxID=796604 RepID=A0A2X0PBQ5_9BASI|nr:BQ5605_C004g03096 [Microbotryum silenes-dioicae]
MRSYRTSPTMPTQNTEESAVHSCASHTRGLTGGTRNARSFSGLHCVVDVSLPASAAAFTACRDRCVPHSQDYLPADEVADEVADRASRLAGR